MQFLNVLLHGWFEFLECLLRTTVNTKERPTPGQRVQGHLDVSEMRRLNAGIWRSKTLISLLRCDNPFKSVLDFCLKI